MNSENILTPVNDMSAGNAKTDATLRETQPKKPYNTPRMIEHGTVENITGLLAFTASILPGCWIAAVVFDEDFLFGPRVNLVRRWLVNDYEKSSPVARLATSLYWKYGERMAKIVDRNTLLKRGFRKLFDKALAKAEAKYGAPVIAKS